MGERRVETEVERKEGERDMLEMEVGGRKGRVREERWKREV